MQLCVLARLSSALLIVITVTREVHLPRISGKGQISCVSLTPKPDIATVKSLDTRPLVAWPTTTEITCQAVGQEVYGASYAGSGGSREKLYSHLLSQIQQLIHPGGDFKNNRAKPTTFHP